MMEMKLTEAEKAVLSEDDLSAWEYWVELLGPISPFINADTPRLIKNLARALSERDALQARLKLAEGLAEAAARVIAMPLEDHGQCVPMHLVGLGLALADWRKAKGE